MLKPVAMTRLSLVILERDERNVLRELGRAGVIQLTRTVAGPDTAPLAPRDRTAEVARWDRLSLRLGSLRQALALPPPSAAPIEPADISAGAAEETLRRMEQNSSAPLKRCGQLLERFGALTAIGDQLSGYRGLEIPLDRPDESSFLHFVTGSMPEENLGKMAVGENVALLPLPGRNGRQLLVAMTTRQNRATLEHTLQQAGFQPETLPYAAGATTGSLAEQNQRELEQVTAELRQLKDVQQELAREFGPPLAGLEQLANRERRLVEAEQNFPRTETAILLTGWMPSAAISSWEQRFREITSGRCAIATAAAEKADEDQIPVLLHHPRLLRPFEMLVTAYGLPKYLELEPTTFVAISYLLMFGMMFGDVGHGALLALGGLAMLLAGRRVQTRDLGLLLLFGGCSSMIFGALFGSYFGLPQFKKFALWHDPLEGNPMGLMTGAVAFGIVMISLGLILNVLNHFRRGDVIGGFLDKFGVAGAVFYWGALVLAIKFATLQAHGLLRPLILLFLVLPVLGWILKEPVKHFLHRRTGHPVEADGGFFGSVMESLVGVFEALLSYFANTVSFVRLGAYAMSHAALLVAAYMIAADVKHFSPGGTLLSVLVIILGNLVALVLEGIVASVQALRLEYYEFFGKFFSGGGQPFKPFRLQTTTVAEAPL